MSEEEYNENQMGLFEMAGAALATAGTEPTPAPAGAPAPAPAPASAPKPKQVLKTARAAAPSPAQPARKRSKPVAARPVPAPKKVSGLVPSGDVRLTANIRQDLHLKLKIASAYRRTTIGEIIEELIEKHI